MELLLIGEVANAAGVSVDTIRHYERVGVLRDVARDASGYRRYPPHTVERVRMIRRALTLGFTLDELSRIFRQRAAGKPPCREVRALADRKLAEVEERIAALTTVRAALVDTLSSWDDRLRDTPDGAFANLFETLMEETK
ncbi:MAG: heavy metal-responsive transcriptional regulator [Acidobacteria bacterium]|nr:heavy metal-responsive transcriptional regulator [Acidobacteriota bacterium]MBV9476666.1 heavy metal-responsive transcriptional regulator [Acidobacteriota bacterium]